MEKTVFLQKQLDLDFVPRSTQRQKFNESISGLPQASPAPSHITPVMKGLSQYHSAEGGWDLVLHVVWTTL